MRVQFYHFLAGFALPTLSLALPANGFDERGDVPLEMRGKRSFIERDGVKRTIFEHEATGATLDFVTNSGICETTPGVNQYSGYISVGSKSFRSAKGRQTLAQFLFQATKICGSGSLRLETIQQRPPWPHGSTVGLGALP
jgi:hypothetical protein